MERLESSIRSLVVEELGREWSLPLLPAGTAIFESLPVGRPRA